MKQYKNKDWLYQKYWEERLSAPKIAEICNCGHSKILRWMKKYEIKRRTIKESLIGRKLTNLHKIKIRNSMKDKHRGEDNPFFGKKHREAAKKLWAKKRKGINIIYGENIDQGKQSEK